MKAINEGSIIIEEIKARIRKDYGPVGELEELPEQERFAWSFVRIYDAIIQAKNIIESRESKGLRTVKKILRWAEYGVIIAVWLIRKKII